MQYLLTQEDHEKLTKRAEVFDFLNIDELQHVCTLAANHIPVKVEWKEHIEPWGCILDEETDPTYCDEYPVDNICPNKNKDYSD